MVTKIPNYNLELTSTIGLLHYLEISDIFPCFNLEDFKGKNEKWKLLSEECPLNLHHSGPLT